MSYFDYHMEHVRLAVLRVLTEAPGYAGNDSVLASAIGALGLTVTRDQLRTQIAWLEEQNLITTVRPTPSLIVAKITERGCDVAKGVAVIPGVQRPSPGA
ncbi:hypothetical protein DBR17_17835 [Sphingomonas sp. HMWF008]|nr:hypothetical protein DBR17_17835 [Sphingomonas sp. HMWF008]